MTTDELKQHLTTIKNNMRAKWIRLEMESNGAGRLVVNGETAYQVVVLAQFGVGMQYDSLESCVSELASNE